MKRIKIYDKFDLSENDLEEVIGGLDVKPIDYNYCITCAKDCTMCSGCTIACSGCVTCTSKCESCTGYCNAVSMPPYYP